MQAEQEACLIGTLATRVAGRPEDRGTEVMQPGVGLRHEVQPHVMRMQLEPKQRIRKGSHGLQQFGTGHPDSSAGFFR